MSARFPSKYAPKVSEPFVVVQVFRRDPSLSGFAVELVVAGAVFDRRAAFDGQHPGRQVSRRAHFDEVERYGDGRADLRVMPGEPCGRLQRLDLVDIPRPIRPDGNRLQFQQFPRGRVVRLS